MSEFNLELSREYWNAPLSYNLSSVNYDYAVVCDESDDDDVQSNELNVTLSFTTPCCAYVILNYDATPDYIDFSVASYEPAKPDYLAITRAVCGDCS